MGVHLYFIRCAAVQQAGQIHPDDQLLLPAVLQHTLLLLALPVTLSPVKNMPVYTPCMFRCSILTAATDYLAVLQTGYLMCHIAARHNTTQQHLPLGNSGKAVHDLLLW